MRFFVNQLLELAIEFILFMIGMLCWTLVSTPDFSKFIDEFLIMEGIIFGGSFWIVVFMYRFMFPQLLVSWLLKFLLIRKFQKITLKSAILINAISFVLISLIAMESLLSIVQFFQDNTNITILVFIILLSTTLSPILSYRIYPLLIQNDNSSIV